MKQTGTICEYLEPAGTSTFAYAPSREDTAFYRIIEGEAIFMSGAETIHATPGTFLFLPRPVGFRSVVSLSGPARILTWITPMGFAQQVTSMGNAGQAFVPSPPPLYERLQRFKVVYKRGRAHIHSPDLEYNQKMAAIATAREEAKRAPQEVVFLYEDEFTAYLRPLVGSSYRLSAEPGQQATGATAEKVRLAACVDASTGRVVWRRRGSSNVKEM